MILFRAGNLHGAGSTPGAYSETVSPARRESAPRAPDARPDSRGRFRNRARPTVAPVGLERAAVRFAVDAAREAADDDEPCAAELPARACARPERRKASTSGRRRRRPWLRRSRSKSASPRTKSPAGGSWIAWSSGGKSRAERAIQRTPDLPQPGRDTRPRRTRARTTGTPGRAARARRASPSRPRRRPAPARSRRSELGRRPVRERLGQVLGADGRLRRERRDRLGHTPRARPAAPDSGSRSTARSSSSVASFVRPRSRHVQPLARRSATRCRTGIGRPHRAERPAPPRAGAASPRRGRSGREAHATACPGTRTAAAASTCSRPPDRRARRRDRGSSPRRAGSAPGRRARPPTRAMLTHAVLERLPQRLERGPLELGELVEDEHASMGEADLARLRPRARPRRVPRRTRCSAESEAGASVTSGRSAASIPATEWMRVTSIASPGESGGRIPGSRRASIVFPGSGRACEQEVVSTGRRDLERATRPLLASQIGEVEVRAPRLRARFAAPTARGRARPADRRPRRRDAAPERARSRRAPPPATDRAAQSIRGRPACVRPRPAPALRRPAAGVRPVRARRPPRAPRASPAESAPTRPGSRARSAGRTPSLPSAAPPERG